MSFERSENIFDVSLHMVQTKPVSRKEQTDVEARGALCQEQFSQDADCGACELGENSKGTTDTTPQQLPHIAPLFPQSLSQETTDTRVSEWWSNQEYL